MVPTDLVNNCSLSLRARRRARDENVVQGMLNSIDRLVLVKAALKCDQELSTLEVACVLASRYKAIV